MDGMDDNILQRPLFSEEPGTLGFDLSSGNVWIYPENYPIREYQFNIVKTALYNNTLVCLPTGKCLLFDPQLNSKIYF